MIILLAETIPRSDELKVEFERLKEEQERATENSTFNFNKKRGITAEMKQFKEQKDEVERFDQAQLERVRRSVY